MERIIGLVFSGFAMRLYAAGFAIWIASEAAGIFMQAMEQINGAF